MESSVQKVVEACVALADYYQDKCRSCIRIDPVLHQLVQNARAAVALPLRNCDVGTAEEQQERFAQFCKDHLHECGLGRRHADCPAYKTTDCALTWAQMPYESEVE